MEYFGSNIAIDGKPLAALYVEMLGPEEYEAKGVAARYEQGVHNLLSNVYKSSTGRALLRAIERLSHSKMTIEPKIKVLKGEGPLDVNAYAETAGLFPEDAYKKGTVVDSRNHIIGTGLGGDTRICFTPNEWVKSDIKNVLGLNSDLEFSADDMLVHEMIHGLRMMAGVRFDYKAVPFQKRLIKYTKEDWENTRDDLRKSKKVKFNGSVYIKRDCYSDGLEEWFAVLVQNMFRSECNRPLRIGYTRATGDFTAKQFIRLGMNRSHMRQFRREHRDLFSDLREIDVAFNPTRLILDL